MNYFNQEDIKHPIWFKDKLIKNASGHGMTFNILKPQVLATFHSNLQLFTIFVALFGFKVYEAFRHKKKLRSSWQAMERFQRKQCVFEFSTHRK